MADGNRMIFLGFGKYARADKIYAIEPIRDKDRGHGRRTLVWVEGVAEPIVASRTERTILADMGEDSALRKPLLDDALDLAERLAEQSQSGKVDLADLGRRARRLLAVDLGPLRRYPAFRRLFVGQTISTFGSEIAAVAAPYQLYSLTHSTLQVGLLAICELVPLLTLTLAGGAIADAFDRRLIALRTEVALAAVAALFAVNA